MWSLVIFFCLTITWAEAQNGRGPQHQDHNGHGWNIRLAVPGEPGNDYPTLSAIPRTAFSCAGKEPGYYADLVTNCQVFRVCTVGSTYGFQSFLCPNGTLFNQAVFVCDWWMNVDCKNSQQLINNNNEKFENLRLGPQLMKDIKKMLTHPMRNPYDKNVMKSNRIVMQDYTPPTGQLFPNGALLAGPERPPNNVYVRSKQIQQNGLQNNPFDYTFSASTPDPQYISGVTNKDFASIQKDEGFIQKQPQSTQYIRTGRVQTLQNSQQNSNPISNSHTGRFVVNSNLNINRQLSESVTRPSQVSTLTQRNINTIQATPTLSSQNNQIRLTNTQRSQVSELKRTPQTENKKHNIGDAFTEPQINQNSPPGLPKFSNEISNGKVGRELKDNLVSTIIDIPTTIATKSFSRVAQKTKFVYSKSHDTVKTRMIRPNKTGRQLTDPTPYTYTRPALPSPTPTEILVDDTTPYIYEIPKTFSLKVENAKSTELDSEEPYIYSNPTLVAKQIQSTDSQPTRLYMAPTTGPTRPTFSEEYNSPSTSPLPTKPSRYYLPPTPFQKTERLYLPPSGDSMALSRQYLLPNAIPRQEYYQSAQIRAYPRLLSPNNILSNNNLNQPPLLFNKDLRLNDDQTNLTFADILTKEKLDITVNDIVKDTDSILKTASPLEYNEYHNDFIKSLDPYQNNVLIRTTDSDETLTSQSPFQTVTGFTKPSRLIATPATRLVPPDESFISQNTNPLSKLPFYKEPGFPNTIERTVSIKITIPEKIAMFLFKNQSDADFDKLEILNTGSSNYLVLSNNNDKSSTKKNAFNFIPIVKLSENSNNPIISDSQALVYSFLTDSINVAREHRNIVQQQVLSSTVTPSPAHFQNLNNQQLSDITNKISQLTSSQFSSNNFNTIDRNAKIIATQPTYINHLIPFTGNLKYSNEHQTRQLPSPHYNDHGSHKPQNEIYSNQFQMRNIQQNFLNNPNKIYSGQLYQWPVPEVTSQIYNQPISANLINSNTLQRQTTQMLTLQRNSNQADNLKQKTPEIEIIKAETINLSPDKLQVEPSNETEHTTSTETLANLLTSGNGISAHLQDKIVGTIAHPVEKDKLVTYETNRSYYLYTKPDNNRIDENIPLNTQTNTNTQKDVEFNQNSNILNSESFQLIPSVNYELEDVEEQQQILDAFQIDEFGAPRDIIKQKITAENKNENEVTTSSVNLFVEHDTSTTRSNRIRTDPPYSGPSSYKAPQSSVGSLERQAFERQVTQSNFNSRLEDFDNNNGNGYPKERPARNFVF